MRVPDEIAVIGYDDIEFASVAAVPLTSVRQPAREMGRLAGDLLLHQIGGDADRATRVGHVRAGAGDPGVERPRRLKPSFSPFMDG